MPTDAGYELTLLFTCGACGQDAQQAIVLAVPVVDVRYRVCQSCRTVPHQSR